MAQNPGSVIMLTLQVVVANLLESYQSTVTVVTKTPPTLGDDSEEEIEAGDSEWEALRLQLSREDISRDTELESLIIRDLIIRHQKFMS